MIYKIETVTTEMELIARKNEWVSFENKIANLQLFSSYDFVLLFWKSFMNANNHIFGNSKKLYVLFLYKNDILIAILPFCIITRKRIKIFSVKYLEFIGQQFFTSYMDVITEKLSYEDFNFVIKWIKKDIKIDMINLGMISELSSFKKIFTNNKYYAFGYSPEAHFKNNKSFEEYKKNVLTTNYRGIVNNSLNRIKNDNIKVEIHFKKYENKDLVEIQRISESKLKDDKYNVYADPLKLNFIKQVYECFSSTKVCFIKIDDVVVSYQVFIYYRNQNMWFDISYDRNYKKYRPGILQYVNGLIESFNCGNARNILGWGDDPHKLGFCNQFYILYYYLEKGNCLISNFWYYLQMIKYKKSETYFYSTIYPKLKERERNLKNAQNNKQ